MNQDEREAEHRRIIRQAYGERPLPMFTEDWYDLHQRHHIAPWTDDPEKAKHDQLSTECWCGPIVQDGWIVHFVQPEPHD